MGVYFASPSALQKKHINIEIGGSGGGQASNVQVGWVFISQTPDSLMFFGGPAPPRGLRSPERRAANGGRRSTVGGRRMADGGRRIADGGRGAVDRGRKMPWLCVRPVDVIHVCASRLLVILVLTTVPHYIAVVGRQTADDERRTANGERRTTDGGRQSADGGRKTACLRVDVIHVCASRLLVILVLTTVPHYIAVVGRQTADDERRTANGERRTTDGGRRAADSGRKTSGLWMSYMCVCHGTSEHARN